MRMFCFARKRFGQVSLDALSLTRPQQLHLTLKASAAEYREGLQIRLWYRENVEE